MDPRRSEAFSRIQEGQLQEARALLEAIVRDDLADALVLETLGDVREKLGDTDAAVDAYLAAVVHQRAMGQLERARALLELVQVVEPSSARVLVEITHTVAESNDGDATWQAINAAIVALLAAGNADGAVALCTEHTALLANNTQLHRDAIELLSRARQRKAAARVALDIGVALSASRASEAIDFFARATALDPLCQAAHHARIHGLRTLGRDGDARFAIELAVAADPNDAIARQWLEQVRIDDPTVISDHTRLETREDVTQVSKPAVSTGSAGQTEAATELPQNAVGPRSDEPTDLRDDTPPQRK